MISNRSNKLKIISSLVILFAIALMPLGGIGDSSAQAAERPQFQVAPMNPDFLEFSENPPEAFYGYIPPPVDLSHLKEIPVERGKALQQSLPSIFDWRTQGKMTPVKNQNPCGTCWVHGPLAAVESKVLIEENTTYDFSEQNLACCTDPSWVYLNGNRCSGGGWSWLAMDTLSKKGTRLESCDPYNTSTIDTEACDDSCQTIRRVTDYRMVAWEATSPEVIEPIKNAIYNNGPVSMAYCHEDSHPYPGSIYYWPNCTESTNHLVCIVGWDDTIVHPGGGGYGAWIVKNSWGAGWGDNGYFYLCYGSAGMDEVASYRYKDYDPNEALYYWDEAPILGFGIGIEGVDFLWGANIFTSEQNGTLSNVEFWTTSNNVQYEIYIYLDDDPSDSLDNLAGSQAGNCQEIGYYSIPLDSPVSLTNGQPFTVAVKMTTPGYDLPMAIETVVGGECEPPIQTGVSFLSLDGDSWDDAAHVLDGCNVCLRARVTWAGAPNSPPQLSNPSVQPPSGTPSTNFYYQVNYYDSDGDSPSVKQVYIDGTAYTMSLYSGSASNGAYRYGPKNLSAGSHNYYFYFNDGKGGTARLPISGSYSGPVVSQENNPPNTPSNPLPPNHAPNVSIPANLSWTGGDPDVGDTVTYDVHFGTSVTPLLVSNDQTGTTYDPGALNYNTKYYWRIIAKDNHEGPTSGPSWDFTTVGPPSPGELHVGPGQPYATIQEGIDDASDGDTIIVHPGTYDGFTIENKNDLSIMGQDGVTVNSAKNYPDWSCSIMAVAMNSTAIHIKDIVFDGGEIEVGMLEGIAYGDSTGSITGGAVRNIVGSEWAMGVCIGGGEEGSTAIDISGLTVENCAMGIMVGNAETNLNSCSIKGRAPNGGYGIMAMDNAQVTMENCEICDCWKEAPEYGEAGIGVMIGIREEYEAMYGIEDERPSTANMTGCTISNNNGGVVVYDDGNLIANFNNIAGNDLLGVYNEATEEVDATNNWWGDASGPHHPTTNPGGTGNEVTDNVNFVPWLDSRVSADDILAYYRAYSGDPDVVDTPDLLKAIGDWAGGTIPPGFTEAISTIQLLQLIGEWASG